MENRNTQQQTEAKLPTTFVSADESAELTKMLELEVDQVSEVAGGLAAVRCCACHCCSCHAV
jgi:hypothetical protein